MDLGYTIKRMTANMEAFRGLLEGISNEQARWSPAPAKWSILELVNHLSDEEVLDFRIRVDITLHYPDRGWPKWDPEGAVLKNKYLEQDFDQSREKLFAERDNSVAWLKSLESPDWERVYTHPLIGDLRAGDLLAAWLVHDFLHLRQLANLHADYAKYISRPYHSRYADPWTG